MATKREQGKDTAAKAAADLLAQQKSFVETVAGYGMADEEIALLLVPPLTVEQLRADFAAQLEMGPAKANLETVSLLRGAVKKGNVTAAIYWTKARMGWTEKGPEAKDKPAPSETSLPATMPTASSLSEKILPFKRQ